MRRAGLTDVGLCDAVAEMVQGLVDADLWPSGEKARRSSGSGQAWRCQNHRGDPRGAMVPPDRQLAAASAAGEIVEVKDDDNQS